MSHRPGGHPEDAGECPEAALESAGWTATWQPRTVRHPRMAGHTPRGAHATSTWKQAWPSGPGHHSAGGRVLYPRAFLLTSEGTWKRRSVHLSLPWPYMGSPSGLRPCTRPVSAPTKAQRGGDTTGRPGKTLSTGAEPQGPGQQSPQLPGRLCVPPGLCPGAGGQPACLPSPPHPRETHHGQRHGPSPKADPVRADPQSPPAVTPGARQAGCHDAGSRGTPRTSGVGGICSGPGSGPRHFLRGRHQFRQRGWAPGGVPPPPAAAPHRLPQSKSRFCTAGTVELAFCPVTRWRSSTTCTASGSLAAGDPERRDLRPRAGRPPRPRRPHPAIPVGAPTAL